jgi:hypothetical protein
MVHVFSTQTVAEFYPRRSKPNLDKSVQNYYRAVRPLRNAEELRWDAQFSITLFITSINALGGKCAQAEAPSQRK